MTERKFVNFIGKRNPENEKLDEIQKYARKKHGLTKVEGYNYCKYSFPHLDQRDVYSIGSTGKIEINDEYHEDQDPRCDVVVSINDVVIYSVTGNSEDIKRALDAVVPFLKQV